MSGIDPAARERTRRAIYRTGQPVRFGRLSGAAPNVTTTPTGGASVTARVFDYSPDGTSPSEAGYPATQLGGITQGERRLLVMADDLSLAGFPVPVQKGDQITLVDWTTSADLETLSVTRVDAAKRAIAGAIELSATGVA